MDCIGIDMVKSPFLDYFSEQSQHYADYRPTYPMALVNALTSLCPSQQHALDCGCGTGQLSLLLATNFSHVTATDASAEQIGRAILTNNIDYRCALAQDSGLPNQSIDLITVAQAAHWLYLPAFYQEVTRVAKDNAVLALVTYGVLHVDDVEIDQRIQHFYHEVLGGFWPKGREHVENGYSQLPFPFVSVDMPKLVMHQTWGLTALMGYLNTWSAVKLANKQLGQDCVSQFQKELEPFWPDASCQKTITWPLSCRVGRVNPT